MGNPADEAVARRLLGSAWNPRAAARAYDGVLVTRHAIPRGGEWTWTAGTASLAGMLFSDASLRVRAPHAAVDVHPDDALLLLPDRETTVVAPRGAIIVALWIPWSDLAESSPQLPGIALPGTALTAGVRAFIGSLVEQKSVGNSPADPFISRVATRMVRAVLHEATSAQFPTADRV